MSTLGQDTFTRANVSFGLGTATDTQAWTHDSGTSSANVTSNEGHITGLSTSGNTYRLGSSVSAPLNVSMRCTYSGTSDQVGVIARRTASTTYYRASLRSGQFEIRLNNAGSVSLLVGSATTSLSPNPFTFAVNTFYWIKFDLNGSTLQAKCWPDGNTEPASYQLSVTDSTISAAGGFGLFGLVSPISDTVTFDNFLATDRGTPNPTLATTPGTLSFSATAGGSSPLSQNDTLAEMAGVGTAWTSSIAYGSGSGWLGISPSSGTLSASGTQVVAFTCTTGSLIAGTYTATVTFTATTGGAIATVVVTFVVNPAALATYSNYKNTIEPNLVAALTAKSLLHDVSVIGPDTTVVSTTTYTYVPRVFGGTLVIPHTGMVISDDFWLTSASADLASSLSGYVRHAFPGNTTDISGGSLEASAKSLVASIYANDNTAKPIIQGEMGDAALGPGQDVALYQYGVEMTDYAVQLARAGMAALVAYDLDDDMHGTAWGMWQITTDTGVPRPWFFPWSVLTQALVPGSQLYGPAQPTSNDVRVLVAQSPQGGWTFVLVNRKAQTQAMRVSVPFAPVVTTPLNVYAYTDSAPLFVDSNGFPLSSGTLQTVLSRGFTVSVAANSVLILTQATTVETNLYDVKRPPLQKRR